MYDDRLALPGPLPYSPLDDPAAARAQALSNTSGHLDAVALLEVMIGREFPGRIALVSSFGAESALLLDLVAGIDRATPVIFLDTGKLFPETLAYRDELVDRLGLGDVRAIQPPADVLAAHDPGGDLWGAIRTPAAHCARSHRWPGRWPGSTPGSPGASATTAPRGPRSTPSRRSTGALRSTRSPIGRPRVSRPGSPPAACRAIRCRTLATRRSAASPARDRSSAARRRARAAGRASPRPSAASTVRPGTHDRMWRTDRVVAVVGNLGCDGGLAPGV